MDWGGWAVFGLVATTLLTAALILAQLIGWTRLDLPLMLGSAFAADPDRARVAGFFVHLGFGQLFARAAHGYFCQGHASLYGSEPRFVQYFVCAPASGKQNFIPQSGKGRAGKS